MVEVFTAKIGRDVRILIISFYIIKKFRYAVAWMKKNKSAHSKLNKNRIRIMT